MKRLAATLLVAAGLAGCGLVRRPPAPPAARYTVGAPYQLAGSWYYPREQLRYDATGLAAIIPDHAGATADGERFEQSALAASHRTLQLPAYVRVTNLENGRSALLRLNDRGPVDPGRLLGLTKHAAALLGANDGSQLRVTLESALTQAASEQAGGGPKLDLSAAPRAAVTAEPLAPPSGVRQAATAQVTPGTLPLAVQPVASTISLPTNLADSLHQGSPAPGLMMLRADEFARADFARIQAARLAAIGATVKHVREGRSESFSVQAGPFATVAQADAALDQARRAGVFDARLVVE